MCTFLRSSGSLLFEYEIFIVSFGLFVLFVLTTLVVSNQTRLEENTESQCLLFPNMSVFPWKRAWVDCLGTFTDKEFVLEPFFWVFGGRREPRTTWERVHFCFLSGLCLRCLAVRRTFYWTHNGTCSPQVGGSWKEEPGGSWQTSCQQSTRPPDLGPGGLPVQPLQDAETRRTLAAVWFTVRSRITLPTMLVTSVQPCFTISAGVSSRRWVTWSCCWVTSSRAALPSGNECQKVGR